MAELVLEIPNQGKIPSLNDRAHWRVRQAQLDAWRGVLVVALQHAAKHDPAFYAVRGKPSTIQLDIGVTSLVRRRDPHNTIPLAKALIDELRLQPAYVPGARGKGGGRTRVRLRDARGFPLSINTGWALFEDDTAEWVTLLDPVFHKGPTTNVIVTTKE